MRGEQYLTRNADFRSVYDSGVSWANREIAVRIRPNGLAISRYGFSVGQRLGKAVIRNKVKRRLREIVRKAPLRPGWDIVIIARVPAAKAEYAGLEASVRQLLYRSGVMVGDYENTGPGAD